MTKANCFPVFSSVSQYLKHLETVEMLKSRLVCCAHVTHHHWARDATKTDQTVFTHQSEALCGTVVVNHAPPSSRRSSAHYRPPLECVCDPPVYLCNVCALWPLCLQTVWPFTTIMVTLIFFCSAVLQGKHDVSLRKKFLPVVISHGLHFTIAPYYCRAKIPWFIYFMRLLWGFFCFVLFCFFEEFSVLSPDLSFIPQTGRFSFFFSFLFTSLVPLTIVESLC